MSEDSKETGPGATALKTRSVKRPLPGDSTTPLHLCADLDQENRLELDVFDAENQ